MNNQFQNFVPLVSETAGSTGVACRNTNRKFIGIEVDKEFYEISQKRLGYECK